MRIMWRNFIVCNATEDVKVKTRREKMLIDVTNFRLNGLRGPE